MMFNKKGFSGSELLSEKKISGADSNNKSLESSVEDVKSISSGKISHVPVEFLEELLKGGTNVEIDIEDFKRSFNKKGLVPLKRRIIKNEDVGLDGSSVKIEEIKFSEGKEKIYGITFNNGSSILIGKTNKKPEKEISGGVILEGIEKTVFADGNNGLKTYISNGDFDGSVCEFGSDSIILPGIVGEAKILASAMEGFDGPVSLKTKVVSYEDKVISFHVPESSQSDKTFVIAEITRTDGKVATIVLPELLEGGTLTKLQVDVIDGKDLVGYVSKGGNNYFFLNNRLIGDFGNFQVSMGSHQIDSKGNIYITGRCSYDYGAEGIKIGDSMLFKISKQDNGSYDNEEGGLAISYIEASDIQVMPGCGIGQFKYDDIDFCHENKNKELIAISNVKRLKGDETDYKGINGLLFIKENGIEFKNYVEMLGYKFPIRTITDLKNKEGIENGAGKFEININVMEVFGTDEEIEAFQNNSPIPIVLPSSLGTLQTARNLSIIYDSETGGITLANDFGGKMRLTDSKLELLENNV